MSLTSHVSFAIIQSSIESTIHYLMKTFMHHAASELKTVTYTENDDLSNYALPIGHQDEVSFNEYPPLECCHGNECFRLWIL